jgi:hypothetical protein
VIPQIDKQIGISVYSTKYQGIGGKIRAGKRRGVGWARTRKEK